MKTKSQFDRVFRTGQKHYSDGVSVHAAANSLDCNRYGLVVTTRAGNAVARNRGRRWMREYIRANDGRWKTGWDIVLRFNHPAVLESHGDTVAQLDDVLHQAGLLETESVC